MLQLNQASIRRGPNLLIEDMGLQAHAGQRIGIIGANGSGKSSLFEMLLGKIDADSGDFSIDSDDVIAHVSQDSPDTGSAAIEFVLDGDTELRRTQAAIAAIEEASGKVSTSIHQLYECMERIEGYSADARAARLLDGLGFTSGDIRKPVRDFSGGWRMRLNLAQALMCRSDLLLLDEPTNHLDLPAILWLERWLRQYAGILLVISHDRDFLDGICTRIAHIENRRLQIYTGNYSQYESQRAEALAQQQSMHVRQQKEIKHIQGFVDRFRYKASKARQAQSRLKMLERMTLIAPAHVDSPFQFHFAKPKKQPQHLLGLSECDLGYRNGTKTVVLRNVELNLLAGDRLGLLGVNGAGKSTLVKALASGDTVLTGDRILSKDTQIGYFAQHQVDLLNPDESPLEHLRRVAPQDQESAMRNYLGRFDFSGERIFEPVAPFSGGEKARLVLALIIRREPNLLLLDEPTNHLDLEMRQALSVALIEYSGALVVISHDRHLLRSVCDDLMIVHDGIVARFDRHLDEYPAWLKEQADNGKDIEEQDQGIDSIAPQESRKEQRQRAAAQRRHLKPLHNKVQAIERQLADNRKELARMESKLADESIYADQKRKPELTKLVKEQASLRSEIEALEWSWLEASELLEAAASSLHSRD